MYKLQVDIQLNYLPIYTHAAAYPILAVQSNLLTVMTHNSNKFTIVYSLCSFLFDVV
jgi:hypothetical protein